MSRYWLTGASSGIGAALAVQLLEQGHRVALGGRCAERLAPLVARFPEQALVALGDIEDGERLALIADELQQTWGALDGVILNAGTCEYLEPGRFDPDLVERVMRINLLGLCHCLAAAL
ncbi:MAG: SDR family oxidoreductase, partial [Pseudomonas sp.]|nr:SDR family oxidoreductase [Pseudomonas sp.]